MPILFKAKTSEGYIIKILSELLQNTIKTACLEVHKDGINLRMMDSHRYILIDIVLSNINFNIYELNLNKTMYLGINLNHLYKMLKSIKKKDSLLLYINDDEIDKLYLVVYPKENDRISKSVVHIQTIQYIKIPLPLGYKNPVLIPSGEYQRTLKDMNNIGDTITVKIRKFSLTLGCSADGIYSREMLFGELTDTSTEHYNEDFDMEQLIRILKISGLSKNLGVYAGSHELPLLIKSNIGQLGEISIYIKSKEQIKMEKSDD
jgi:proliferating cell nuclear antigen